MKIRYQRHYKKIVVGIDYNSAKGDGSATVTGVKTSWDRDDWCSAHILLEAIMNKPLRSMLILSPGESTHITPTHQRCAPDWSLGFAPGIRRASAPSATDQTTRWLRTATANYTV